MAGARGTMLRRLRALSRRQKALLALTAGAAGAVAYYVGTKYVETYVDSLRDADRLEAVQARQLVVVGEWGEPRGI